jgi:hypothetical protein
MLRRISKRKYLNSKYKNYFAQRIILNGVRIIFMVTPCINDIRHFNVQLKHTTLKI